MSARRSITTVTGPAAEPVILAEAKNWAKIDITDDDPLLAALITAAIESAEKYLKRSLISRTLKLSIDSPVYGWARNLPEGTYDLPVSALSGILPSVIQLPAGPVQSVSSVVTYDLSDTSSTFDPSNYRIDSASGRFTLKYNCLWPSNLRQIAAAEITYIAGYGATSSSVPMPIKTAILMHVQTMYDSRMVCEMPDSCKQLLNQYRIYGDGMR